MKIKLPTPFYFFILIAGLILSISLVQSSKNFFSPAASTIVPKNVKVTNITDATFTVSWITETSAIGFVNYGENNNLGIMALDDRDLVSGSTNPYITHHITIKNLKPENKLYFKVGSNDKEFDYNGKLYEVNTAATLLSTPPASDPVYGVIVKKDGTPAEGAIVYLTINNSAPLSTLVKDTGSWVIPINQTRSFDLTKYATYQAVGSNEEIYIQFGKGEVASATTQTGKDKPYPNIMLGKTYDFRTEVAQKQNDNLLSVAQVLGTASAALKPSISNPSEGEIEKNNPPQFLGTGKPGETVEVVLQSNEVITTKIKVNDDGHWAWTPPSTLSEGQHTITITTTDQEGKKLTVVRNFTVAKKPDVLAATITLPSFTSTPSASTTPVITQPSTPTPTVVTPKPQTPIASPSMPKAGNLAPTITLFVLGLGFIFAGILWKLFQPQEG